MPSVFLVTFLLSEFKLFLLFSFSLFTTAFLASQFSLFLLKFQCLLCFRANTDFRSLLLSQFLQSFWIDFLITKHFIFDCWTEFQVMILVQNEVINLIVLGFFPKGYFGDLNLVIIPSLKNANPEWIFEQHRQCCTYLLHCNPSFILNQKKGQPRRQVTDDYCRSRTTYRDVFLSSVYDFITDWLMRANNHKINNPLPS